MTTDFSILTIVWKMRRKFVRLRMRCRGALGKYEKMKEEILRERMVSHTFFRSCILYLPVLLAIGENTSIGRRSMYARLMGNV